MTKKLQKEIEALRIDLNATSTAARYPLLQAKILNALDTKKNGVWRKLRDFGLLPQQREELHGIGLMSASKSFHKPMRKASGSLQWMLTMTVVRFSTQAIGSDGIPQLVIVWALPFFSPY